MERSGAGPCGKTCRAGGTGSAGGRIPTAGSTGRTCPWKGTASYYSLLVDGELNPDAVWTYPDPKPEAEMVRGRVAFWKGVKVEP